MTDVVNQVHFIPRTSSASGGVGPQGPQGEQGPPGESGDGNIDGGAPDSVYGGTPIIDGGGII